VPKRFAVARTTNAPKALYVTAVASAALRGADATHTNAQGAAINVGFIRTAIQQLNITPLVNYLR
jgi:hypothetical protein